MQCMLIVFTVHEHYQVCHIYIFIYTQSAHVYIQYIHTVYNIYAAAGGVHALKVEEKKELEEEVEKEEARPQQESRTERRGRP